MNTRKMKRSQSWLLAVASLVLSVGIPQAYGQQPSPSPASASATDKPYLVEWDYKLKWGHADEYWQIFKKYQIPILNREKELGYVKSYTVYRPALHTSEDIRWEYRIVVVYRNQVVAGQGSSIAKELFPDQKTFKREENHRWELVEAHWDLPIRQIDPNGDGSE